MLPKSISPLHYSADYFAVMPIPCSINDFCRAIYCLEQGLQCFELPCRDADIDVTFQRAPPVLEVFIDGSSAGAINVV
ncbi:hypothetical protein ACVMFA_005941 [Bradyrhizobium liaoningense]